MKEAWEPRNIYRISYTIILASEERVPPSHQRVADVAARNFDNAVAIFRAIETNLNPGCTIILTKVETLVTAFWEV